MPLVEGRTLHLEGLISAFDGFRILLLADVHAGAHMDGPRTSAIVWRVNDVAADLVLVAGDMVDGRASLSDIRGFARAFRDVEAPEGVLAVPGNHDHYVGIAAVTRELRGPLDFLARLAAQGGNLVVTRRGV